MSRGNLAAADRARAPSVLVGFGLGAFLDGIVLHQVLQWHHLVVSFRSDDDLAGLESNTFWDGAFHLASWLVIVVGLMWLILRREALPRLGPRAFIGYLLIGWGAFNIVDQVVFHMLLEAHHIRMVENYQLYDWGYTLLGALLIAAGALLVRNSERTVASD